MIVGERLRTIREEKGMSQGDIEQKTGLLRCYISRVENGHTIPAIETLEKLARAMDVPLYQIFNDGQEAKPLKLGGKAEKKLDRKSENALRLLRVAIPSLTDRDRKIVVRMAQILGKVRRVRAAKAPVKKAA